MQGVRGRIDLVFKHPASGKVRVTEVKSGNCIREVHRIQAALYWPFLHPDEITVSNSENDEILSPTFIQNALERAAAVKTLLVKDPSFAARSFTPHPDACYTCGNAGCPHSPKRQKNDGGELR
jgi:hypothetical protein